MKVFAFILNFMHIHTYIWIYTDTYVLGLQLMLLGPQNVRKQHKMPVAVRVGVLKGQENNTKLPDLFNQ